MPVYLCTLLEQPLQPCPSHACGPRTKRKAAMSVYGSAMSTMLPWQPGEKVCTTAYLAFIAPLGELALHSSRTSSAHVFCRTCVCV